MAQRDTSAWHIARANELAIAIDAASERPTELINEFHRCVRWCETYAPHIADLHDQIRCYQNW
jgi:hypothetical protein